MLSSMLYAMSCESYRTVKSRCSKLGLKLGISHPSYLHAVERQLGHDRALTTSEHPIDPIWLVLRYH